MDGTTHIFRLSGTLVLIAGALFLLSFPAPAMAQSSCRHSSEGDGSRFSLRGSEEARVSRALEEVREESGREVFVCHLLYTGGDRCLDHLRRVRTFGDEDAVIRVSNTEETMVLARAPGLSREEISRISDSMSAEFQRNGYAAGISRGARELEDRLPEPTTGRSDRDLDDLIEDRLLEMRGGGIERPASDPSWLVAALICAGTVAVLLIIAFLLKQDRFRSPVEKTAAEPPPGSDSWPWPGKPSEDRGFRHRSRGSPWRDSKRP